MSGLPFFRPRLGVAGPEHAAQFAELHRTAFPRGWTAKEMGTLLSGPGGIARAMWRNNALKGFALGRAVADEAEVLSLVVTKPFRRQGWGATLLTALEDACRDAGARAMFLEVSDANEAALSLYARAGYLEVGRRPRYYEDGAAALTMRKDLGRKDSVAGD